MNSALNNGTRVETTQGIGTVAGSYLNGEKLICMVRLDRGGLQPFLAANLTVSMPARKAADAPKVRKARQTLEQKREYQTLYRERQQLKVARECMKKIEAGRK